MKSNVSISKYWKVSFIYDQEKKHVSEKYDGGPIWLGKKMHVLRVIISSTVSSPER